MEAQRVASKTMKHRFTTQEDALIKHLVETVGLKGWKEVAMHLPGLSVRQVRERYVNYIQQHTAVKEWTVEEDELLVEKYKEVGSRWAQMAPLFPGRTDVHLKNRMKLLLRRMKKSSTQQDLPAIPTRHRGSGIGSPASSPVMPSPISSPELSLASSAPAPVSAPEEMAFEVFFDETDLFDFFNLDEISI